MNNPLSIFQYEGQQVRTIEQNGEPWFVAYDVATILGYSKPANAVSTHCKAGFTTPKQGGGFMTIIPERDVYRLIMKSNLPSAERFENWVVGEVLPSIRKTGTYSMQPMELISRAVIEAQKVIEHQTALIANMTPKAEFYDAVTGSSDAVDIGSAAKVLNLGIGRTKLFQFLRDEKILQRNNQPYQQFIDAGHFRVIESSYNKPDGSTHISLKTVVYQKGIDLIRKRYMSANMQEAA